jgi:hypothetical protein
MSTICAVFVYTWVTLAVLGLEVATRINMFLRLFGCLKATMGGSGRTLYRLDFFSTDVQCSRMVLKLFLRQGWYVRTQWVLLHFCFSLYWSKMLLEILWALLKLFLIILCWQPLFKYFFTLTQSFFQRFVGGANSHDSKSLTILFLYLNTVTVTTGTFEP